MNTLKIAKPANQSVTFVELFFDLVFVFSITQVVRLFHNGITWSIVGQATLVFWLIWWAWTQFAWTLNTVDTENSFVQIAVLIATGIAFFMAVGVPHAFGASPLYFAIPYILVKIVGNSLMILMAFQDASFRATLRAWFLSSIGGLVVVLIGAYLGGNQQYWLWGLAIILDLYSGIASGNAKDTEWIMDTSHFAERHGLIVIIALGETLILAASGVSEAKLTIDLLLVGILTIALISGLWWSYFSQAMNVLEEGFNAKNSKDRLFLAFESYSFMHFIMLGGIILFAGVIEHAMVHPLAPLSPIENIAFAIGIILFVNGMAFAQGRATGDFPMKKIFITLATGILIVLFTGESFIVSQVIALIGLLVVGIFESK